MLVHIYMKYHEDILNGFQVTERTRFCDGQTDRQTDGQATLAKTIYLPTLKVGVGGRGGDIMILNEKT